MPNSAVAVIFLKCFPTFSQQFYQVCASSKSRNLLFMQPARGGSTQWNVTSKGVDKYETADALHEVLLSFQPSSIYIAISAEDLESICSHQYKRIEQLVGVIDQVANKITNSVTKITLLVDNRKPIDQLTVYARIFRSSRILQSNSARAFMRVLLDEYRDNESTKHPQTEKPLWTGSISIGSRFAASEKQQNLTQFPGFLLRMSPDASETERLSFDSNFRNQLSQQQSTAEIVHVSETFPLMGAFFTPQPGLEFSLSTKCTTLSSEFYHSWLNTNLSILLQINEHRFWCTPRKTVQNKQVYKLAALHITEMSPSTIKLLDTARYRREEMGRICRSAIRDIPYSVSQLPVVTDVFASKTETNCNQTFEEFQKRNKLSFLEATSVLAKRKIECVEPVPHSHGFSKKRVTAVPPAHLITSIDVSKAERHALASMETHLSASNHIPSNLSKGKNTSLSKVLSRFHEGNHTKSTTTPGSQKVEPYSTDLVLRRSRFARLHTTRGVNQRPASSGTHNGRGKEALPCPGSKQTSRKPRTSSSRLTDNTGVFLELEMRRVLSELEQGSNFYAFSNTESNDTVPSPPFSWKRVSNLDTSSVAEDPESYAIDDDALDIGDHGHGADYANGEQFQNKRIWTYENLVSRSSMEFAGMPTISKEQLGKLNHGIAKLKSLAGPCDEESVQKRDHLANLDDDHSQTQHSHDEGNKQDVDTNTTDGSKQLVARTLLALKNDEFDDKEKAAILALLQGNSK